MTTDDRKPKILFLYGSLRERSYSRLRAEEAARIMTEFGAEVRFFEKNSRRSQMAEGFARQLGTGKIEVASAGLEASHVDPVTVEVMSEVGIDISHQKSKSLSAFNASDYDVVISLCGCGVNLPEAWVLREVFQDWQLEDPEGQGIETFRQVRSQVKERIEQLIQSLKSEKANV